MKRMPALTLAEQESVVIWNRAESSVQLWTASPVDARKWKRAGYELKQDGLGWRATGPRGCVRLRKVRDGVLVKRSGRVPNNLPRKVGVPF
jgi:hypothetical protein